MNSLLSAVGEELCLSTANILQGVRQDRQALKGLIVIDRLGQSRGGRSLPGGDFIHAIERVTDFSEQNGLGEAFYVPCKSDIRNTPSPLTGSLRFFDCGSACFYRTVEPIP